MAIYKIDYQYDTAINAVQTAILLKPFRPMSVLGWGVGIAGSSYSSLPIIGELIETSSNGTGVQLQDTDFEKIEGTNQAVVSVAGLSIGSSQSQSGLWTENAGSTARLFDTTFVSAVRPYNRRFPQGQEPVVMTDKHLRLRIKASYRVTAFFWVDFDFR